MLHECNIIVIIINIYTILNIYVVNIIVIIIRALLRISQKKRSSSTEMASGFGCSSDEFLAFLPEIQGNFRIFQTIPFSIASRFYICNFLIAVFVHGFFVAEVKDGVLRFICSFNIFLNSFLSISFLILIVL